MSKIVLTEKQIEELKALIERGNEILAVKNVHGWAGAGLRESKNYVDSLREKYRKNINFNF